MKGWTLVRYLIAVNIGLVGGMLIVGPSYHPMLVGAVLRVIAFGLALVEG